MKFAEKNGNNYGVYGVYTKKARAEARARKQPLNQG
jgi:hypothetical protein